MKNKKHYKVLEMIDKPGTFWRTTDRIRHEREGYWDKEGVFQGPITVKVRTTKDPFRAWKYKVEEASLISEKLKEMPGFKITELSICCSF